MGKIGKSAGQEQRAQGQLKLSLRELVREALSTRWCFRVWSMSEKYWKGSARRCADCVISTSHYNHVRPPFQPGSAVAGKHTGLYRQRSDHMMIVCDIPLSLLKIPFEPDFEQLRESLSS